jgi:hypothetical protein
MPSDCWKNEGDYATKQAERTAWFNRIAPKPNWKAPIDCWIGAIDFDDCSEASVFFTGSKLSIVGRHNGFVHVTAPGYYATIGA